MSIDQIRMADAATDLNVSPYVFGAIAFSIFVVLLIGVLMFGKGRPHS